MYKFNYTHRQTLPITFNELHAHADDIRACIPRVAQCDNHADGSCRITTHPIRWTPFVTLPAIGWVVIETSAGEIKWHPKTCAKSVVCLSGKATPAADGNTQINATINITIPKLPAVSCFGQMLIEPFIKSWQATLLDEFINNWNTLHSKE